jgi:hypothetical protein
MPQLELFEPTIEQRFMEWFETPVGQEVYTQFVAIARRCVQAGHYVGAKAIVEYIRFNVFLAADHGQEAYKINNVYVAHLARVAMRQHPDLAGCFETRSTARSRPSRAIIVPIRPK